MGLAVALALAAWGWALFLGRRAPPGAAGGATGRADARAPWRRPAGRPAGPGLHGPGEVRGAVRSPAGGVGGAQVCALGEGAPRCAGADAFGAFRLRLDPGRYVLVAGADGFAPPPAAVPPSVRVAPGRHLEGIVLHLVPGAARLSGTVEDRLGGPIDGATVVATGAGGAAAVTRSDEDGAFTMALRPGPWRLSVWAEGYVALRRRAFAPAFDLRVRLLPAAEIQGRVYAPGGAAPVEAEVEVRPVDGGAVRRVRAAGDGSYAAGGLPPGVYEVRAVARGACGGAARQPALSLGEVARVDLHLDACGDVEARVTTGSDGAPCTEGAVEMFGPGDGPGLRTLPVRGGRAEGVGLLPGPYRVRVRCGRGDAHEVGAVEVAAGAVVRPRWHVPAASDTGAIRVTVRDAAGDAVAGAQVHGLGADGRPVDLVAAADGEVEWSDVPAGPAVLWADDGRGRASARARVSVAGGGRAHVTLELAPAGRVEGRVEDEQGGPLQVAVRLVDARGATIAATASSRDGAFTMGPVSAARGRFVVPGLEVIDPAWVDVPPGRPVQVVVRTRAPDCRLTVEVRGPSGEAVPDALVAASGEPGEDAVEAVTDARGGAVLEGLPAGPVHLVVTAPRGHATQRRQAACPGDETIDLPGAGRLEGVVEGGDGAGPVLLEARDPAGIWQRAIRLPRGRTDWALDRVPAGRRIVISARAGATHGSVEVEPLAPGEERGPVVLVLRPLVRAHGVLLGPGGAPVAGAWVLPVFPGAGAGDAAAAAGGNRTDTEGRFRLDAVPVGPVTVVIQGVGDGPHLRVLQVPAGRDPADLGAIRIPAPAL